MVAKCQFCKNQKRLYVCRLFGDVYVKHLFHACLECILKMGLIIIEVEADNGKEPLEGRGNGKG